MKDILYAFANNINNELISVIDAQKGNKFYCPLCNGEMILRKGVRKLKRPHFAHKNLSINCSPETILHFGFKNLLFDKVNAAISKNEPIYFEWECKYCEETHKGNLLKKADSIKLETEINLFRPDLCLYDNDKNIMAAIEIVVTHPPEPELLDYYKNNNIVLIRFDLKSDKDLSILYNEILNPTFVDFCYNPKCSTCNNYLQNTYMEIIEGICWKCKKPMKVAVIENDYGRGGSHVGPQAFKEQELAIAKSKGVYIKEMYSRTMNEKYKANVCTHCGSFSGEFYLFTDYVANYEYDRERFKVGYNCSYCTQKLEIKNIQNAN